MPTTHAAAAISQTFASVGRTIVADEAEAVARYIATCPSLDAAIANAAANDHSRILGELLSYKAARAEAADPAVYARRLRTSAADHRDMARRHNESVDDLKGRRTWASVKGDPEAEALLEIRIGAAVRCAALALELALKAELQAEEIERSASHQTVAA